MSGVHNGREKENTLSLIPAKANVSPCGTHLSDVFHRAIAGATNTKDKLDLRPSHQSVPESGPDTTDFTYSTDGPQEINDGIDIQQKVRPETGRRHYCH